jgi:hypothetical protein
MKSTLKTVWKTVWIFYSTMIAALLFALMLMPREQLLNNTPDCESLASTGKECFACGMTRGFGSVSEFDIDGANSANKGSVYIFGIFVLNTLIFVSYITIYINKKIQQYGRGIKWEKAV